ncbi:MAG: iron-containing redox enzyme family protein [Nostocaceae cyanobacterium]|nr:iron-containing redox enzyme family protein [Nostocaceae cyanobacterium]
MNEFSDSVIQSLHEFIQVHPLWNHNFLKKCKAGQLTFPEVQILAVQMYKFSKEFNRILAGILSRCPDENAQLVILENLFDEMGQGDPQVAHPELFRRFTRALEIDDTTLAALPTEPETQGLIETYLTLPHRYSYLAALGAVCFASEGIVGSLYTQLYQGIIGAAPLPLASLTFFEVHINVDDSHAAKLLALIEPRITTRESALILHRAVVEALDARVRFFDGIERQISASELADSRLAVIST